MIVFLLIFLNIDALLVSDGRKLTTKTTFKSNSKLITKSTSKPFYKKLFNNFDAKKHWQVPLVITCVVLTSALIGYNLSKSKQSLSKPRQQSDNVPNNSLTDPYIPMDQIKSKEVKIGLLNDCSNKILLIEEEILFLREVSLLREEGVFSILRSGIFLIDLHWGNNLLFCKMDFELLEDLLSSLGYKKEEKEQEFTVFSWQQDDEFKDKCKIVIIDKYLNDFNHSIQGFLKSEEGIQMRIILQDSGNIFDQIVSENKIPTLSFQLAPSVFVISPAVENEEILNQTMNRLNREFNLNKLLQLKIFNYARDEQCVGYVNRSWNNKGCCSRCLSYTTSNIFSNMVFKKHICLGVDVFTIVTDVLEDVLEDVLVIELIVLQDFSSYQDFQNYLKGLLSYQDFQKDLKDKDSHQCIFVNQAAQWMYETAKMSIPIIYEEVRLY